MEWSEKKRKLINLFEIKYEKIDNYYSAIILMSEKNW